MSNELRRDSPDDTTLNWYGSGDVNKDNKVDVSDVARTIDIMNGYTNPSDIRLLDRSDFNVDGVVDIADKTLIENYVNNLIPYLPGQWNKLQTRAERERIG